MLKKKSGQAAFALDYSFWNDPERWPHDPPRCVFLARAFHEIGTATYRDGWVKPPRVNEPEEPEDPPDDCDEEIWDKHEQEFDRYEQAYEKAHANCKNMWANVARTIFEACGAGTLVSAARARVGGEMTKLEPHHWNTEGCGQRFYRCVMSLAHPFSDDYPSTEAYWIYVTRESLNSYIDGKVTGLSAPRSSGERTCTERSTIRRRRGRSPGAGAYKTADEPLLLEMRRLIENGSSTSPHHAAGQLAQQARGAGTLDSKQSRLEKAYRKRFPTGEK